MAEIRKDIFPRMVPFLLSKEQTIGMYVDESLEALSPIFSSKEELIEYINSLDTPETVEHFLNISKFYLIAKKYQTTSYVKLIMIISAIERIINKDRPYLEFYFWIDKQKLKIEEELSRIGEIDEKSFRKIIRLLREDYFAIYGSRRNILDFFQNHLTLEQKCKLIRSIRTRWTKVISRFCFKVFEKILLPFPTTIEEASERRQEALEMSLMPYCYDWKHCYIERECHPEIFCPLIADETLLDKTLKKVVTDIYQLRNDFVHTARITPLNEEDAVGTLGVVGSKRKPISIELTAKELETIFETGLKHYFDGFRS